MMDLITIGQGDTEASLHKRFPTDSLTLTLTQDSSTGTTTKHV